MASKINILFICSGNMSRSQIAAAYLEQLQPDVEVVSAGTQAIVGKPLNDDVVATAAEDGLDFSQAYRKQLTQPMVEEADRVISFVDQNDLPDYARDAEFWPVPDPRGQGLAVHRMVRDDIKQRVTKLSQELTHGI